MAGLGADLLAGVSAASRQVAKKKKAPAKRRPVPKAMRESGPSRVKKEAPAKKQKQEIHLGESLLSGIGSSASTIAKGKAPAKAAAHAPARSKLAGLQGTAHPVLQLPEVADFIAGRTTRFGTDAAEASDTIAALGRQIGNKFGAPTGDGRVATHRASGGGLPLAAANLGVGAVQGLAALPGLAAAQISKLPGVVADFYADQQAKQPGIRNPRADDIAKNLVNDLVGLGTAPVVLPLQLTGAVQTDVTHGNLKATKQLAGELGHALGQDPFAQLAGAAIGVKGASVGGALRSVEEHPGFAAASALGVAGAAGRGAGAVARGAGSASSASALRRALAEVGDTRRSSIGLTHDAGLARQGYVAERKYSKDLGRKAVQVLADKGRRPIVDADKRPVTLRTRGKDLPVVAPKGGGKHGAHVTDKNEGRDLQRKRADFLASQHRAVEVPQRQLADKELYDGFKGAGVKGRAAKDITGLLTSGTISSAKTFRADVLKRADHIADQLKKDKKRRAAGEDSIYTTRSQRQRAVDLEKQLRAAAGSKRVLAQVERVEKAGLAHARDLNKLDAEEVRLGIREEARNERARLSEHALAHMDAKFFREHEHQALERDALAVEHSLPEGTAERAAARDRRIAVSGRDPVRVVEHERARDAYEGHVERLDRAEAKLTRAERSLHDMQAVHRSERMKGSNPGARKATPEETRKLDVRKRAAQVARDEHKAAEKAFYAAAEDLRKNPLPETVEAIRHPDGTHLSNKEIADHARERGRDPDTLAFLPHVEDELGGRAFHKQLRPGTRPRTSDERRTGSLYDRGATSFGEERVREQLTHKRTSIAKAELLDRQINEGGLRHPDWPQLRERAAMIEAIKESQIDTNFGNDSGRMAPVAQGPSKAERIEAIGGPLTKAEKNLVKHNGYLSEGEAGDMLKKLDDEGHDFVAVRHRAATVSRELADRIDNLHDPIAMETAQLNFIQDRLVKTFDKQAPARNIVLYPRHDFERQVKHLAPAGSLEKAAQMLNGPFRTAVLPQPRWLTGNFIEPFIIRLPLSGAGINLVGAAMDRHAATVAIRELKESTNPRDRQEAAALEAQLGGLFVGRRGASVRRTFEDLEEGSKVQRAAYRAHLVRNMPVMRQLGDMVLALPKAFFALNRVIESEAQKQALGKSIRSDIQEFTGSWAKTAKVTGDVFREVRDGSLSSSTLQRWTKEQHILLGKYEGFDPVTRRTIQSVAPFLPWWLASMRFMYYTLPAQHSVAEALLLRSSTTNEQMWKDLHSDTPPGALRQAIPTDKGGLVDLVRYGPAGATVPLGEGEFSDVVDQFMPQLGGLIAAAKGKDPFGRDLKVSSGNEKPTIPEFLLIAANTTAESLTPLLALGRRIREGGGTGYADSTFLFPKVKPGTDFMSGWRRALDPFRPTYLHGGPVEHDDDGNPKPRSGGSGGFNLHSAASGTRSTAQRAPVGGGGFDLHSAASRAGR